MDYVNDDILYSATAYDDAFRTMETECDDLRIPYVNYTCCAERLEAWSVIKQYL